MQALRRSQSDQASRGSPDAGSTSSSHSRREELPSALALLTGTSLAARSKMRCLDLTASRMEALPIMLRSFGSLEWLNLSDNRLRALPDWIATHLCCLREVDLSRNRFTDAVEVLKLGGLPALRSLDLRGNPLSDDTQRPFLVQALLQPRVVVADLGSTEASRKAETLTLTLTLTLTARSLTLTLTLTATSLTLTLTRRAARPRP